MSGENRKEITLLNVWTNCLFLLAALGRLNSVVNIIANPKSVEINLLSSFVFLPMNVLRVNVKMSSALKSEVRGQTGCGDQLLVRLCKCGCIDAHVFR